MSAEEKLARLMRRNEGGGLCAYPIEIHVDGGLEHLHASTDTEADIAAIVELLKMRNEHTKNDESATS